MQFQVPQFIETEDKIVGPLTLRQFLYLAGAGGIAFFFFFFIQTWLWLVATVFLGAIGTSLAFLKINGRPLPVLLRSALAYYWKPRLFLWQREKGMARTELPELESEKKPKTTTRTQAPLAERLAFGDKLKGLLEKLQTSKAPIPKRESVSRSTWRGPAPYGAGRGPVTAVSGTPPGAAAGSGDVRAPAAPEAKKGRLEVLRTITGAPQVAKRVDYR